VHSDPHVFSHYLSAARGEHVAAQFLPNISCTLRALISTHLLWLQALPTLLCIGWACWFWIRHRQHWSWERHGAFLIAASVLTAPYSWPVDQVLFLPAILTCLLVASKQNALLLAAMNLLAALVMLRQPVLSSPIYTWMAPAWMIWCLWTGTSDNQDASPEPVICPV
jgi:hypothetical protein